MFMSPMSVAMCHTDDYYEAETFWFNLMYLGDITETDIEMSMMVIDEVRKKFAFYDGLNISAYFINQDIDNQRQA